MNDQCTEALILNVDHLQIHVHASGAMPFRGVLDVTHHIKMGSK
jgi:hypothetical protein